MKWERVLFITSNFKYSPTIVVREDNRLPRPAKVRPCLMKFDGRDRIIKLYESQRTSEVRFYNEYKG